jgi:xanthine dehydrogenase accessory factor
MNAGRPLVLIRGGGDLATGVAHRLHASGFDVVVTETAQPLAVRRLVSLAEAVYAGRVEIEGMAGVLAHTPADIAPSLKDGFVPVIVDPRLELVEGLGWAALVDGRMRKRASELPLRAEPLIIGLGPGFNAGQDCHAVVETNRGHHMGRVYWQGAAEADTGVPEPVQGFDVDRVLRAPVDGVVQAEASLGDLIQPGQVIARVGDKPVEAAFAGALRGLIHDGVPVKAGMKIGDLDPRREPSYCTLISDKSLAVGGGVLEALLSRPAIRRQMAG